MARERVSIAPLARFWLGLERIPGFAAVEAEWRYRIGDDFECVRDLLLPDADLAQSVPCHAGPGRCYDVVYHADDDIVGVCPDDGERITLHRHDLIVYRLSVPHLARKLQDTFELPPTAAERLSHDVWRVGTDRPTAGFEFPIFLVFASGFGEFRDRVTTLIAQQRTAFRVLTPTGAWLRSQVKDALEQHRSTYFPLGDGVQWQNGQWRPTPAYETWWKAFHAEQLPQTKPQATVFFPTPSGAKWPQVQLQFLDGERVSITVQGERQTLNYTQMGFVDGRSANPNKQWELLRIFAKEGGYLSWMSSAANPKLQKQKEQLAHSLQAYFRISGEPIRMSEDRKSWQCVFRIQGE